MFNAFIFPLNSIIFSPTFKNKIEMHVWKTFHEYSAEWENVIRMELNANFAYSLCNLTKPDYETNFPNIDCKHSLKQFSLLQHFLQQCFFFHWTRNYKSFFLPWIICQKIDYMFYAFHYYCYLKYFLIKYNCIPVTENDQHMFE